MKTGNSYPMTHLEILRKELGLTQAKIASDLNCDIKTYRNYEKGNSAPGAELLIEMHSYFNSKGITVSTDYILGLSDFRTPENDYIGKHTGLSDTAIKGLQNIKRSDDNATFDEQPGLCVLPVLNDMLGVYGGNQFEQLLRAFRDYINTDYCVPVYHTGKGVVRHSDKYETVLEAETITSSSDLDIIKGQHPVYLQHFAKENDLYDNIPIVITKDFMQAVALKQVEQSLMQLRQDIVENK